MTRPQILLALTCAALATQATADESRFVSQRAAMVETIRAHSQTYVKHLGADGISERVLTVMGRTKRHLFVPERYRSLAYGDGPIAIGHGQTISQPFIVAMMTELAKVEPEHTALEIGTGSGYQAAILSPLVRKVCTIEIVQPLGEAAAERLKELGYDNVEVRVGDGYAGWPDCGPFDAVIVTAALGHVPPPLLAQLKVGGRLVMPVGPSGGYQRLTVVEKTAPDKTKTSTVGLVRFVPFTRARDG